MVTVHRAYRIVKLIDLNYFNNVSIKCILGLDFSAVSGDSV